jgi:hypothetical protein
MRILKAAVLLAASAACAAAQGQRPLEATLRRGAMEALFSVDEPAYVAVFEAIPGQGIQQIFPRSTMQASRPVEPGEYLLSRPLHAYTNYGWEFARPYARPVWMLDAGGRIAGYYYTTGWNGPYGARSLAYAPTRTLLMVASRFPLRLVGGPDAAQHWLQRVVGFRELTFSVAPTQSTFDDIVAAVLPTGAGVDDVVVDVLDLIDQDDVWHHFNAQSITFRCPGGSLYSMNAQFFFESGDFWCPLPRIAVNSAPVTPVPLPVEGPPVEGIKGFRRVPTKTDVAPDEGVRALPRGVRNSPVTPSAQSPVEEGVRMYNGRRAGGSGDDGPRVYRRGAGAELPAHSSVLIGETPHVEGVRTRGVGTVNSAYVPPGAPSAFEGYRGRVVPDGRSGGNTPYVGGMSAGFSTSASSGSSAGTASAGSSSANASAAASASAAQAAQAARSAESRATIDAARPAATATVVPPQP